MDNHLPPDRWHMRATLLREMTARVGIPLIVPASDAVGLILHQAARRCRACRQAARCDEWLRRTGDLDEKYAFCPNAESLDRLRCLA
jgi:hypothetical protein